MEKLSPAPLWQLGKLDYDTSAVPLASVPPPPHPTTTTTTTHHPPPTTTTHPPLPSLPHLPLASTCSAFGPFASDSGAT